MTRLRIDVHCHFMPDFYREALIAAGQSRPDGIAALPDWCEDDMLRAMDDLGIERAYLSISSPGVHFGDDSAARKLARRVNEEGARLVRAYPGRFGFFASTPLPDVAGTLDEIAFAFDELGADGVIFETNFHGLYLGDNALAPVYRELDRRGAVLFLHPTAPGCSCGCGQYPGQHFDYPAPMMEFIFDTTRSVTNMVLSGTLDRFPNLHVIVPHAGAALPILAARIDLIGPMLTAPGAPRPPSMRDALRRFHFDLAGVPVPQMLDALLSVADPQHLHFGSDWPFTPTAVCKALSDALDGAVQLDGTLRTDVYRNNALRLFTNAATLRRTEAVSR